MNRGTTSESSRRTGVRRGALLAGGVATFLHLALSAWAGGEALAQKRWPWEPPGSWPTTSTHAVEPLQRPTLAQRVEGLVPGPAAGFRFAVFGDQRALADGEWQVLLWAVARDARRDPRLLFLVDTGDIVGDGRHTDQWGRLRSILSRVPALPYLVAVGNHEVHGNRDRRARENCARFLSAVDGNLGPDRLYYSKDVGPLRLIVLDSNDLVVADTPRHRVEAQIAWLRRQLGLAGGGDALSSPAQPPVGGGRVAVPDTTVAPSPQVVVVVMHHPFVQSSRRHLGQARDLWNRRFDGQRLVDLLADGGVALVLVGHTHTHERFRLERRDGRSLVLVNLSGRPRGRLLGLGAWGRRSRDLRGREDEWLREKGWDGLDEWHVEQEAAMTDDETNQYGIVDVGSDGALRFQVVHTGRSLEEAVLRRSSSVELTTPRRR